MNIRHDVPAAFDAGAAAYDGLVDANPGYHDHLRLSARRMALPDGGRGMRLLDAGCGTGASTAALLAAAPHAEIVAVDGSAGMLAQARAKDWPKSVSFIQSYVEQLAANGVHGPFDGIFAAYLVRNLADPDTVLRTFRDLLRPGSTLAVHEYSVRDSRSARMMWNLVSTAIIIPMGRIRTGDAALYRYLRDSVNGFDGVSEFLNRLRQNGFVNTRSATVSGWQRGVVHTFLAESPR
ncbi:ubiquinone biosynthesis methyltransferase UbiE [Mycolicibacterium wolinskyi]|uniref:Ubiquinone biosynthesis methyltransferase UbiE n=1 Tax=Mycolicibacterium wolinskyi TaxID=59750 RepID=A0A132PGR1_9MYCO|nr:class I SAM-dependent methyltransferase [Mycolicibacterium wolinskyi]KWX21454.1 ubiquinone biosynthesis methyltransferase UbiE [Mycolicibacterium wolinskyi]